MIAKGLLLPAVLALRDHGKTDAATAIARINAPDPAIRRSGLLPEMPA
jgi:hypothetical protein